jgi:uncharacterized caspase-like protein
VVFQRLCAVLFFTVAATFASVGSSFAETRVALVIGNGAYQNAPQLPNPANDANDVAAALRRDGFDTILATNLTRDGMEEAAIRFSRAARDADVAMFYYSGHAIQFAGINYLAPVDIQLQDEADLRRMIRVDEIVLDLQQAKNLRILVLDSCRDNPLAAPPRTVMAETALIPRRSLGTLRPSKRLARSSAALVPTFTRQPNMNSCQSYLCQLLANSTYKARSRSMSGRRHHLFQ